MEQKITLIEARNYLVKGCAPQIYSEGEEFPIDQEGPVNQRRWQIADGTKHIFRSQRHKGFGRLALVRPELTGNALTLRAEGIPSLNETPFSSFSKGWKLKTAPTWGAFVWLAI